MSDTDTTTEPEDDGLVEVQDAEGRTIRVRPELRDRQLADQAAAETPEEE